MRLEKYVVFTSLSPGEVVGGLMGETLGGDVKLNLRLWWQVNRQACAVDGQ